MNCMDPLFFPQRRMLDHFYPFRWHSGRQKLVGIAKEHRLDCQQNKAFLRKHCQNKTSRPNLPRFHTTHSRRQQSGPPHLHRVYDSQGLSGLCRADYSQCRSSLDLDHLVDDYEPMLSRIIDDHAPVKGKIIRTRTQPPMTYSRVT